MKKVFVIFIWLVCWTTSGQDKNYKIPENAPFTVDSTYREDQFYLGFNFNLITNKPDPVSQESFSGGAQIGYIRDMPINAQRNLAIGIGAGWTINTYGQNLRISGTSESANFEAIPDGINYSTNRFTLQTVEVPLELRWRTSTFNSYKFWRIYAGLRAGYAYSIKTNFRDNSEHIILRDLDELNPFRLAAAFTFGYSTFNFQFQYDIIPFFDNAEIDTEPIDLSALRIGLVFYIL